MADRSHLVPTPITDRNGRRTTVYRRPGTGLPAASLPAPSVSAAAGAVLSFEERLSRIAERNRLWNSADRPEARRLLDEAWGEGDNAKAESEFRAAAAVAYRLLASLNEGHAEEIREDIHEANYELEFARVVVGVRYRRECAALLRDNPPDPADPAATEAATPVANAGWEAYGFHFGMETMRILQKLDLMYHDRLPAPDDQQRFLAHAWSAAVGTFNSVDRSTKDINDCRRLIDERPQQVMGIASEFKAGMSAAGIRAVLDGKTIRPLADGAL